MNEYELGLSELATQIAQFSNPQCHADLASMTKVDAAVELSRLLEAQKKLLATRWFTEFVNEGLELDGWG